MTTLQLAIYTPQRLHLPSQRIRLVEPLSALRAPVRLVVCSGFTAEGQYVVDGKSWTACDTVIIQRNFPTAQTIDLIRQIAAAGKRMIYETDDAFSEIPADHPKAFHRANAPFIAETARLAQAVVVSTPALARHFADCRHVVVSRNQLSPRIWNGQSPLPRNEAQVRLALVGGNDHYDDFDMIRAPLAALTKDPRVRWAAYGDGAARFLAAIGAQDPQLVAANYDYASHPARLAAMQADIALCPLRDNEFNRCKSDIKAIEFGWLGVPCIVSDLPPYADSVAPGVRGLRCSGDAAWAAALQQLIDDADARRTMGAAARDYVLRERMLSVGQNPWNAVLGL